MPTKNKLIDGFGRQHTYLRVSVTDRCNLRCIYCMPNEGIVFKNKKELLTYEEILRVSRIFVSMGINKIRLTGGEPLVRKDLETLISELAKLPGLETLAMTTNATLLAPKAKLLRESGLTALNVSLDTFRKDRFMQISRREDLDQVINGLNAAMALEFPKLKLNMVVMCGVNDDEILDFADFARHNRINVRFIEYMPFKDNEWKIEKVVTAAQIKALIETKHELSVIETEPSAVAKDFAIVGGKGSISFITSMSESFCSTCNRIRLTADGSVKSCLFYPAETSLRDALRRGADDAELERLIMYSLALKPEAHPPAEEIVASENRTMIEIGG
jgi:GTP 3',8-cyclase